MTDQEIREELEPLFKALVREYRAYAGVRRSKPSFKLAVSHKLAEVTKNAKRYERVLRVRREQQGGAPAP